MRWLVATVVGLAAFAATIFATSPAASAPAPVVVIFMENKERSTIEGSAEADYLKAFEDQGRSFTHYYGVTHPSLPNYLAFASGATKGKSGTNDITAGELAGSTIWKQLQRNGISWRVYQESMPSPCYAGSGSGDYVLRHNPATPFASVFDFPKRCAKVVPYTQFDPANLPAVAFITPNLCNDMHDCSIGTGDNWLAARVPAMLAAGATVFITFDEGSSGDHGGGNVYAAVRGPGIGSSTNTGTFNHYSLLAALEQRFGLKRLTGATPVPIS